MNFRFTDLTLQFRESREHIRFSPQVSYFHGQIGTGKSSTARLIDFCLGGGLERTPALSQELVTVQLSAILGEHEVLLEREAKNSNAVQVTWKNPSGLEGSVLAPIRPLQEKGPIWGDKVYNLSDLIFYLSGITPLKIRRGESSTEPEMVRLSFRDVMWYCYLEQDRLDSSFFNLESPIVMRKSRYVMRFIVGALTERLGELDAGLAKIQETRSEKIAQAQQILSFLGKFGYSLEGEINSEIQQIEAQLAVANSKLAQIRDGNREETHFADGLRAELRQLNEQLSREEQVLSELKDRIKDQESLRAEFVTAKFKLARSSSAKTVFAGVRFERCPACGRPIGREGKDESCPLCGQSGIQSVEEPPLREEMIRLDLDSRITEIDESLERHKKAVAEREHSLRNLREKKNDMDTQLESALREYDSRFLANALETEKTIAAYEERVRGLKRLREMPKAVASLEREVDMLAGEEEAIKRDILKEKEGLKTADFLVQEIESSFVQSLLAARVPGVEAGDIAKINRTTWMPEIFPGGDESKKWSFHSAGSGGKKTLFNVCFALAVHKVATQYNRPLPTFLIIDTPMKNIGEDVNKDIFEAFYNHLYELAEGPLHNTQFIIIDKEYFSPKFAKIDIVERYFTINDKGHPPLVPYYRGP